MVIASLAKPPIPQLSRGHFVPSGEVFDQSPRALSAMFGMDRTLRATSAPGRIAELLADERPADRSNSLDRVLGRQPARLQQFVKFVRELVGDRGLELIEAIEVDIKGFLRHRLADQVVDGHRLDRFRA